MNRIRGLGRIAFCKVGTSSHTQVSWPALFDRGFLSSHFLEESFQVLFQGQDGFQSRLPSSR